MKVLFIIRGLPGSGKSTLAEKVAEKVFEADQFFCDKNGDYSFDHEKIKEAHNDCFERFKEAVNSGCKRIAVSNTFTKKWEFSRYKKYAEEYDYLVFVIIAENRHGGESVHYVPNEAVKDMGKRFEIKL